MDLLTCIRIIRILFIQHLMCDVFSSRVTSAQSTATVCFQRRHENVVPLILNTDSQQHPSLQQLSPTLSPPLTLAQVTHLSYLQLLMRTDFRWCYRRNITHSHANRISQSVPMVNRQWR